MERRRGVTRRSHSERNWRDLGGGKRERMVEWSAIDDLRRYLGISKAKMWRANMGDTYECNERYHVNMENG